jgi:predicted O-linked N-acetylglucosamine transferase (SPINDLY family)
VKSQPKYPPLCDGEIYCHDRIRVAYLSADFREHPVTHLAVGLFERHDKSRFEITAISFTADSSPYRDRLNAACERFIDAENKSDQEITEIIRNLEIDIAVDLMGYTLGCRPGVFGQRPAPIQVNYLGYPGTTGSAYMDYIIADEIVIPSDQLQFYSENVVWLPDSYQVNDDRRIIAQQRPTRRQCGLPETGFVFCCFNNNYKITPDMFDVWMRLLQEVDDSIFWLPNYNTTSINNLRRAAECRGVAVERLVFADRLPNHYHHLARLQLADLFLDTLPFNAHTTASDALWAGLPVITCLGAAFPGRVAASVLKAAGLDELITASLADYETLALKLARDPALLAGLKAKIAGNRNSCALFNTDRSRRHIEQAYTMMVERQRRGEPPRSFSIQPK